jgi:murein DD-endopeptidase MepM/ murein hydrolase activator NlpD
VTAAGWDGGFGRSVRIRHDRGLESVYSHLSRIEVVRGENVAQGERVGLVGATGLATGPHLDFRILENNKYINPTKRIVPAAPPVSPAQLAGFVALRDGLRAQLDKLPGVAEDENPPASASNTGGTVAK